MPDKLEFYNALRGVAKRPSWFVWKVGSQEQQKAINGVMAFLDQHGAVYLKPTAQGGGRGLLKIARNGEGVRFHTPDNDIQLLLDEAGANDLPATSLPADKERVSEVMKIYRLSTRDKIVVDADMGIPSYRGNTWEIRNDFVFADRLEYLASYAKVGVNPHFGTVRNVGTRLPCKEVLAEVGADVNYLAYQTDIAGRCAETLVNAGVVTQEKIVWTSRIFTIDLAAAQGSTPYLIEVQRCPNFKGIEAYLNEHEPEKFSHWRELVRQAQR